MLIHWCHMAGSKTTSTSRELMRSMPNVMFRSCCCSRGSSPKQHNARSWTVGYGLVRELMRSWVKAKRRGRLGKRRASGRQKMMDSEWATNLGIMIEHQKSEGSYHSVKTWL